MMITLGLTTWSEHPALINQQRQSVTLAEYAEHFPTVEVDTFFYGIPRPQIITGWQQQVPAKFQFIVKANQALTGHPGEILTGNQLKERFKLFAAILAPLQQAGQLKTILCQFPPFFEATTRNVAYLKFFRQMLPDLPLTLELRHRSWYQGQNTTSLIKFCREQRYTLAVVDEPTGLPTSIPLYPAVTTPELMFWRLHGRNQLGWQARGKDWRKQRTLYRYSAMELTDLKQQVEQFTHQVQEICIIFNNNSARDAAPNALQLQKMLGLHFSGLNPKSPEQLGLF